MKTTDSIKASLDADSLAIAAKLGDGNVSEGIRKALKPTIYAPGPWSSKGSSIQAIDF